MVNMFISGVCFAMVATNGKFNGVNYTMVLILLGILNFIFGYNPYKRRQNV